MPETPDPRWVPGFQEHPQQRALDTLYYLYFAVSTQGDDFVPAEWVADHAPELSEFLETLHGEIDLGPGVVEDGSREVNLLVIERMVEALL